ncbi:cyclic lactone autoinducer peptide [Moorella naiadis]
MKRLCYRLLPACFSFLTLVALTTIKPACTVWWYQPEVPAALKK